MFKKIIIVTALIASFFLGRYIENYHNKESFENENIFAERSGTGNLISPLLECELSTYGSNQRYIPFEDDIKDRITKEIIEKNPGVHLSLYFRNLRNGPWFGINSDEDFAPASLMKLPIAISYMKWGEYDPSIWSMSLTGITDPDYEQNIIPEKTAIPGKTYSIEELINLSLVHSDNNANTTLLGSLPQEIIYKVFTDLNLPIISKLETGEDDYISVREYASFFRILYNASYLSDNNSSYLLGIMTQSLLPGGIRESIPKDIFVSHKFGERRIENPDGKSFTSQFHDCGIIYYDKYPYILCVMTKGDDNIPLLEKMVQDTSKIVFDEIKKRYY